MKTVSIRLLQDKNEFEVVSFTNTVQLSVGMRVNSSSVADWCAMPRVQVSVIGLVKADDSETPLLSDSNAQPAFDTESGGNYALAREFDAVMLEYAAAHGWLSGQMLDDAMVPDPGANNLGTMGIKGAIARREALAVCRRNCARDIGLDHEKIASVVFRGEHLGVIKTFVNKMQIQPF